MESSSTLQQEQQHHNGRQRKDLSEEKEQAHSSVCLAASSSLSSPAPFEQHDERDSAQAAAQAPKPSVTFEDLKLSDELLRGIYAYGFEKPSFIQQQGIPPLISGRDAILQAQSGTGKTGTFCIGVLQVVDRKLFAPQALLLSPTRELAMQTHTVLNALGDYLNLKTHACVGGTVVGADVAALRGGAQIIVGTPGRVCSLIDRQQLRVKQIKMVVLDEADELLTKGFVESMRFVLNAVPAQCQLCLISATLPDEIVQLTEKFMRDPVRILIKAEEVTLEGISQYYVAVDQRDKYEVLTDLFSQLSLQQTMVYCNSRRSVEYLQRCMQEDDFVVSAIHSELDALTRASIMKAFRDGRSRVLLSTDLTSRGIDVQTVSLVINYDIPRVRESYIHRIGRSGRHGRKGTAINFVSPQEAQDMSDIESFWKTTVEALPQDLSLLKL